MRFAEKTAVSSERSKAEIERLLTRYGAQSFASGWQGDQATIAFVMAGRRIRFFLPLPSRTAKQFTHTAARNTQRSDQHTYRAWEQATRQRWRALALVVKAKLEAVESGITSFDTEFMPHIVLPNGKTVSEMALPAIEAAYTSGKVTALLPGW